MKQLHTYLFFISLLVSGTILGQEETNISARDTLPPSEKYGLRVGVDIGRLIRTAVNDDYSGFEINADYRVYKNYYLAAEIGNESLLRDETNIEVEGSGSYIRLGIDYNTYKNWYGMQNNIYAGLRYGFTTFDQTLNNYNIFTGTDFFDLDNNPENFRNERRESKDLTAGWIEFVLGLKVEVLNNLYLGASVSLRRLVNEEDPAGFENLFIPGYGRTNDFSEFGVGYTYTISYLIPFIKRKR
ncbi:hypothetical protein J8L88_16695 [Aquimarina sp. MMG015]|uniref:DUF6048 family protein n=1 Tax=Aquimarina TaxID=290174 RepID=UPI0003F5A093|nr:MULTISPECIES: DUF6048 family protein [Aquimarina]AXT55722.1 hypothetical protein D1815_08150 [Aquimarina sp. AD1]MBQ4804501.1 hypothetical protein [Aquimarina sp. MMG015]RKN09845.1 hypothetical protein D7035_19730 [Aquimarina sp. AD1]